MDLLNLHSLIFAFAPLTKQKSGIILIVVPPKEGPLQLSGFAKEAIQIFSQLLPL